MKLNKFIFLWGIILNISYSFSMFDYLKKTYSEYYQEIITASNENNIEKVKELIVLGVDLNAKKYSGDFRYPLGNSMLAGHEFIGTTALMVSACKGHIEIVKLLINAKADLNLKDNKDKNALWYAAQNDQAEIVELLIGAGINLGKEMEEVFLVAVWRNNTKIVNFLLKNLIFLKDNFARKVFEYAISAPKKNVNFIKLAIESSIDINLKDKEGETAIMKLAKCDYSRSDEMKNKEIWSRAPDDDSLDWYNKNKIDTRKKNYPEIEILQLLVDAGADITLKNNYQKTALDGADYIYNTRMIKILKTKLKKNIWESIEENNLEKFKKNLLTLENIKFKDNNGDNLLHKAITARNSYFFGLILSLNKYLIYKKNNNGQTPIELAIQDQNMFNILKQLLNNKN